jgi:hypothetical protein
MQNGRRPESPDVRSEYNRRHLLKRYGLTAETFQAMLEAQGGVCAICHGGFGTKGPSIDHDHTCCPSVPGGHGWTCGKCVRGLLCIRCNTALEFIDNHRDVIDEYLAQQKAQDTEIRRCSAGGRYPAERPSS